MSTVLKGLTKFPPKNSIISKRLKYYQNRQCKTISINKKHEIITKKTDVVIEDDFFKVSDFVAALENDPNWKKMQKMYESELRKKAQQENCSQSKTANIKKNSNTNKMSQLSQKSSIILFETYKSDQNTIRYLNKYFHHYVSLNSKLFYSNANQKKNREKKISLVDDNENNSIIRNLNKKYKERTTRQIQKVNYINMMKTIYFMKHMNNSILQLKNLPDVLKYQNNPVKLILLKINKKMANIENELSSVTYTNLRKIIWNHTYFKFLFKRMNHLSTVFEKNPPYIKLLEFLLLCEKLVLTIPRQLIHLTIPNSFKVNKQLNMAHDIKKSELIAKESNKAFKKSKINTIKDIYNNENSIDNFNNYKLTFNKFINLPLLNPFVTSKLKKLDLTKKEKEDSNTDIINKQPDSKIVPHKNSELDKTPVKTMIEDTSAIPEKDWKIAYMTKDYSENLFKINAKEQDDKLSEQIKILKNINELLIKQFQKNEKSQHNNDDLENTIIKENSSTNENNEEKTVNKLIDTTKNNKICSMVKNNDINYADKIYEQLDKLEVLNSGQKLFRKRNNTQLPILQSKLVEIYNESSLKTQVVQEHEKKNDNLEEQGEIDKKIELINEHMVNPTNFHSSVNFKNESKSQTNILKMNEKKRKQLSACNCRCLGKNNKIKKLNLKQKKTLLKLNKLFPFASTNNFKGPEVIEVQPILQNSVSNDDIKEKIVESEQIPLKIDELNEKKESILSRQCNHQKNRKVDENNNLKQTEVIEIVYKNCINPNENTNDLKQNQSQLNLNLDRNQQIEDIFHLLSNKHKYELKDYNLQKIILVPSKNANRNRVQPMNKVQYKNADLFIVQIPTNNAEQIELEDNLIEYKNVDLTLTAFSEDTFKSTSNAEPSKVESILIEIDKKSDEINTKNIKKELVKDILEKDLLKSKVLKNFEDCMVTCAQNVVNIASTDLKRKEITSKKAFVPTVTIKDQERPKKKMKKTNQKSAGSAGIFGYIGDIIKEIKEISNKDNIEDVLKLEKTKAELSKQAQSLLTTDIPPLLQSKTNSVNRYKSDIFLPDTYHSTLTKLMGNAGQQIIYTVEISESTKFPDDDNTLTPVRVLENMESLQIDELPKNMDSPKLKSKLNLHKVPNNDNTVYIVMSNLFCNKLEILNWLQMSKNTLTKYLLNSKNIQTRNYFFSIILNEKKEEQNDTKSSNSTNVNTNEHNKDLYSGWQPFVENAKLGTKFYSNSQRFNYNTKKIGERKSWMEMIKDYAKTQKFKK